MKHGNSPGLWSYRNAEIKSQRRKLYAEISSKQWRCKEEEKRALFDKLRLYFMESTSTKLGACFTNWKNYASEQVRKRGIKEQLSILNKRLVDTRRNADIERLTVKVERRHRKILLASVWQAWRRYVTFGEKKNNKKEKKKESDWDYRSALVNWLK